MTSMRKSSNIWILSISPKVWNWSSVSATAWKPTNSPKELICSSQRRRQERCMRRRDSNNRLSSTSREMTQHRLRDVSRWRRVDLWVSTPMVRLISQSCRSRRQPNTPLYSRRIIKMKRVYTKWSSHPTNRSRIMDQCRSKWRILLLRTIMTFSERTLLLQWMETQRLVQSSLSAPTPSQIRLTKETKHWKIID